MNAEICSLGCRDPSPWNQGKCFRDPLGSSWCPAKANSPMLSPHVSGVGRLTFLSFRPLRLSLLSPIASARIGDSSSNSSRKCSGTSSKIGSS